MSSWTRRGAMILVLALIAAGLVYAFAVRDRSGPREVVIRLSSTPFIGEAPTYVAYQKGFFREEGLDVVMTKNPGGWMNLKDLFEGRADIATVAELPIVYSAFDRTKYTDEPRGDFYIIGDLVYSNAVQQLVVRTDHGIAAPQDLRGKRVGVFRGTTLDFFMDGFLTDHRVDPADLEIIDGNVEELDEMIIAGDVDAVFTWEPHVSALLRALGSDAAVLESRTAFTTSWLVVVMADYARQNPDVLERYLRALVKADEFIAAHPEEAIDIHAELSGTDRQVVADLFEKVEYDLTLGESMLTTMEAEARWAVRSGAYASQQVPNFLDFILLDPLQAAKPSGVQIVR